MTTRPFVFGIAASGENFTDRENETMRLLKNFKYGVNTILISPRRWGKTSLVKKAISLANEDEKLKVVYLDIFSCRNAEEFYNAFASAIIRQTSTRWEEIVENVKSFLSKISPRVSFGPDPLTDFSVSLDFTDGDRSIEEILNLPERIAREKDIRIVVCIDEFQQIGEFDNSLTFQKRLRAVWQLQESTSYCLFGSKRHLMNEIFESRSHPFYKFGDAMYLTKIPTEYWEKYITGRFKATGKAISASLARKICETVDNHSSYVQQLSWLTWIHTDETATEESFQEALNDLIAQNSALFINQTENLSAYQLNFLKALAQGVNTGLSSKEVMDQYQLGSSANVAIVKKSLSQKELIDTEGRKTFLADPVMGIWLQLNL